MRRSVGGRNELLVALSTMMGSGTLPPAARERAAELVELAAYHKVQLAVLDLLAADGALPSGADELRARLRLGARTRRLGTMRTIQELDAVLGERFIVVKGPVAADRWWADPDHRDYGDLDVLVRADEFDDCLELLEAKGFEPLLANWHGFARHGVGEVPLGWRHIQIDLHWNLVALASDRSTIHLDTDAMFDRSVRADLGGTEVRCLDDTDALIHLCVNAGLGGARHLRALVEIDRAFPAGTPDDSVFVDRARSAGAHALCAAVLQRCRRLMATPVPDELLTALRPWPGWLATNDAIDRWSFLMPGGRSTASGVWLASGRPRPLTTFATAARSMATAVMTRTGSPDLTQAGGELDWKRSISDPDDEAWAREDYLAWVDHGRRLEVIGVDARSLESELRAHEPRTTPMIGAALDGLDSRRARSHLVLAPDGSIAAALTTYRWMAGRRTAYPLVLDPAAAVPIAALIDRLGATDMTGFDEDVAPLRPLLSRWRRAIPASAAYLPPGFSWEAPTGRARRAVPADIDKVTDLLWHHAPHAYPTRRSLRRRVRRAVDGLAFVVEGGSPPEIVGVVARDSVTPTYHCWAVMTIEPRWRGKGLSWDLVAAAAAEAAAVGAGGLAFAVASNPMPIPEDAHLPTTWWYVDLDHPARFIGERPVRAMVAKTLASLGRRRSLGSESSYRTPGANDDLKSTARTQSTWNG